MQFGAFFFFGDGFLDVFFVGFLEILVTLNANEQFQLHLFHLIYAFLLIEQDFGVAYLSISLSARLLMHT